MDLTKDNIVITQDGDVFIPIIGCKDIKSRTPQAKQLKQQIVDDHEKARKLDFMLQASKQKIPDRWDIIIQNQKLRELIEKKREEIIKNPEKHEEFCSVELQALLYELLKESKNE